MSADVEDLRRKMDLEIENVIKVIFPDGIPGMSVPHAYVYIKHSQSN